MIYQIFDYLLIFYVAFIGFLKGFVNETAFLPAEISALLFDRVTYLGFSPTPRLFWIGVGLLAGSLFFRFLEPFLAQMYKEANKSLSSSGKDYLRRHNLDSKN